MNLLLKNAAKVLMGVLLLDNEKDPSLEEKIASMLHKIKQVRTLLIVLVVLAGVFLLGAIALFVVLLLR